jgi:preprotein translocase subunit SecA
LKGTQEQSSRESVGYARRVGWPGFCVLTAWYVSAVFWHFSDGRAAFLSGIVPVFTSIYDMLDFLKKLFGDGNERQVKLIWPIVHQINEFAAEFESLTDDELRGKTEEFKRRIRESVVEIDKDRKEVRLKLKGAYEEAAGGDGQAVEMEELTLEQRRDLYDELDRLEDEWLDTVNGVMDDILPEAFAVIKETCRRMVGKEWEAGGTTVRWDMVPYDVQLVGGVALHQGKIAEMKTGEGKTLVAVAPVYLNALVGRGVHLVTVNSYLAQRDAEWMGPIFAFHGLTVDVVDKYEPHSPQRRAAYAADITYGTNNEFGFDYLRDNSFVMEAEQLVQRDHHFAIVDEVDSVLVDEARTPLIISGPVPQESDSQYSELKPPIDKLVYQQQKLVAQFVTEAERKLKERENAEASGDRKKASQLEDEAGLALLRAQRGFPKNKKLQKLLGEPGMAQLLRKTEFFYLQDNAKNMPYVDEALMFALDEKQHSIEMTDQGRDFATRTANESPDFFVLPDMGDEVAKLERAHAERLAELKEQLEADESLSEETRAQRLENEKRPLDKELQDTKRNLQTRYAEQAERLHAVHQLLKAYTLFEKDDEYIVQDGKVMIVDEHTGRVMTGRRYSDGLHQAIEAKENVKVQASTQTYATITLQNYFRMYDKLAGMTGTAETEAEEFFKIYKLAVVVIPTNRPIQRSDLDDLVYKSKREKYNAVLAKIREYHEKGQPVLVGTTSVEVSETVSRMLTRQGIKHNVLNAKQDRAKTEAMIVAEAGQRSAVTIATNMAGRGTDIKLGQGVKDVGGLAILGTERHESRRIDLQLRGRSGRQGDPGESQFYVSLEDDLMRLFGSDRTARVMDKLGLEEGAAITHPWVNKSIERAQKKVEQNNFAIRKRQLEYDDVLNAQRQVIYDRRQHALKGERLRGDILDMLHQTVEVIVRDHYGEGTFEEMRVELLRRFAFDYPVDRERLVQLGEDGLVDDVYDRICKAYHDKRDALARPFFDGIRRMKEQGAERTPDRVFVDFTDGRKLLRAVATVEDAIATHGHEINDALERSAMLAVIDERWTEHLRDLDEIKEGVGLRAFGQRDPLIEYKMEAFKMFESMMETIGSEVVSLVLKAGPLVDAPEQQSRQRVAAPRSRLDANRARTEHASSEPTYGVKTGTAAAGALASAAERDPSAPVKPIVVGDKYGRNDMVNVLNPSTGERRNLKFKHAQNLLERGWTLED